MESFDSLLTCCICLDRFRNPKLLPCQHTFCMEPCMEGLIDYVKRQVKCPECRAEHRIPYKGIQDFPSNVTMQRFLDMYSEISGELPDPTQGQVMERCQVCNEKEYLQQCAHCDKKICPECKSAHVDVLKRELTRINGQVRRGLHRLQDIYQAVDKNANTIQQNCIAVREEVENIGQRLIKAIQDRTEYLKAEVDSHMANEVRNLNTLKGNLEQEISNIESNSELAEKHLNDQTEWDDAELTDAKDIFLKTVEFIRNFEHEAPTGGDVRRPVRFSAAQDPNSLSRTLEHFGELNIGNKQPAITDGSSQGFGGGGGFPALMPPGSSGPGLMRSKSDHRLVSALRQQEERGYGYGDESGRSSPVSRRRFGERVERKPSDAGLYGEDSAYDSPCERRHKYRSRFTRRHLDADDDMESYRPEPHAAHAETAKEKKKEREKVLDTDDATKGPISGIARILDVPRVIQKVVESERPKRKKEEPKKEAPAPKSTQTSAPSAAPWRRQKSEDDEITKIKKMNQEADARCQQGASAAATATETPAASATRTSTERRTSQTTAPTPAAGRPRAVREESGSETDESRRRNSRPSRPASDPTRGISDWVNEPFETPSTRRPAPAAAPAPAPAPVATSAPVPAVAPAASAERPRRTPLRMPERRPSRSQSSESTSSESSEAAPPATPSRTSQPPTPSRTSQPPTPSSPVTTVPPPPAASAAPATPATPSTPVSQGAPASPAPAPATPTGTAATARPRFQSRFLGRAGTPKADEPEETDSTGDSDSDTESETETSSESESESEDEPAPRAVSPAMARTSIGPLLARSAHARTGSADSTNTMTTSSPSGRGSRVTGGSSYGAHDYTSATPATSNYASRYGGDTALEPKPYESRYGSSYGDHGGTQGNGLARSRTSSALETPRSTPQVENNYAAYAAKFTRPAASRTNNYSDSDYSSGAGSSPRYSSYTSRFLNRSKSSAALEAPEEAARPAGDTASPGPAAASAGGGRAEGTSRYAPAHERRSWLARSGSSSEQADERGGSAGGSPSGSLRPSATRQASGEGEDSAEPAAGAGGSRNETLSSWAQYLKNKYGYKNNKDPSKEVGKALSRSRSSHLVSLPGGTLSLDAPEPSSPVQPAPPSSALSGAALLGPRGQYLQKGRLKFKLGTRGGGPGCFTWPRGIAVGPDNSIVVADSSNHRVQVFDQQGNFVKEFGQYGNGEAEFDCLAGVSVNRIGQFIISDRYNHRIQIFDPSGRFLRSFGQNGTMDGRFNYPWGVTTDALGFIYVCDKENHRVQVFQSDGTFVGTIGSEGHTPGQLAHPHYIAVSATNRVVVTDSNNHRVQVFDVNGKCLNTFGGEGGEEGKFKFPRGVAVDDQGYIIVGDSGNNRIQVFEPDGTFLKAFGSWGSQDGEFKGLEGVAVMTNGNILVCDRENHRVQVF